MNDDDLERLLSGAFDAQAHAGIGDHAQAPPPRFAIEAPSAPHRRGVRLLAPLIAAAAVVAVALSLAFVSFGSNGHPHTAVGQKQVPSRTGGAAATTSARPAVPTKPVHVKLLNSDGADYGVGMPVIAYFSKKITSGKALQDATTVSVNGKRAQGAWYFEYSSANAGYPVEGHFRLQNYWPAHSKIHLAIPAKGLSAGTGLSYDDDLTLDFTTHARIISTVDDSSHRMTVTEDGRTYGTFPVSLGASATPTARGTKVIMEKGRSICMRGPGYYECGVKYTQRLTYGGEYLHAAPWNVAHIASGVDSSNGCTNLRLSDAERLYRFLNVGDVVTYPNADGPAMTLGAGYGDWNVSWTQWRTGGLVPTN